jgi:hypothetical protein
LAAQRRSFLTAVTQHAAAQGGDVAALEAAFGELLACYRALRLATERYIFADEA